MVYLDADNNLEDAGVADFSEMSTVGSNDNINIVVQMDRTPGESSAAGNWTDTRRFYVKKGDSASSTPLEKLGEVNMGDGNELKKFIVWAITNYPAKKYALVLWNHGGGWRAKKNLKNRKAICWDDTNNGDCLYMLEMQAAVKAALQTVGIAKLDLIGFDACLMGMIEVASDLKDIANVMTGSEETEPGDGWPYNTILSALAANPTMTAIQLADIIVTKYAESYQGVDGTITQAAIDLSKIGTLNEKVKKFVDNANQWSLIKTARTATRTYSEADGYPHADLYHFMSLLKTKGVTDPAVLSAAEEVKTALKAAVINTKNGSSRTNSNGLAIFFPKTTTAYNNADGSDYKNHQFHKETGWDNFLKNYFNPPADKPIGGTTTSVDGSGTAKFSRTTPVTGGKKITSLTFYFTATEDLSGGEVTITVPEGWTAPTTTSGANGEIVKGTEYSGVVTEAPTVSGRTITVKTTTLPAKKKFKFSYKKVYPPTTPGVVKFIVKSKGKNGTLKEIAVHPTLTIQ